MWAVVVVLWIAEGGVTDGDGGGVGGVTAGGGGLFVDQSINRINSEQPTRNERTTVVVSLRLRRRQQQQQVQWVVCT